jgi:hypothetical protein
MGGGSARKFKENLPDRCCLLDSPRKSSKKRLHALGWSYVAKKNNKWKVNSWKKHWKKIFKRLFAY